MKLGIRTSAGVASPPGQESVDHPGLAPRLALANPRIQAREADSRMKMWRQQRWHSRPKRRVRWGKAVRYGSRDSGDNDAEPGPARRLRPSGEPISQLGKSQELAPPEAGHVNATQNHASRQLMYTCALVSASTVVCRNPEIGRLHALLTWTWLRRGCAEGFSVHVPPPLRAQTR